MKVVLVQGENSFDVAGNFEKIKKDIICNKDSRCLIYPEAYLTGYTTDLSKIKTLEEDDKRFDELTTVVLEYNVDILVGYIEKYKDDYYIAYKHLGKNNEIYRKTHLGKKEMEIFTPGNELKIFQIDDLKIGVALCVESHFPEISQTLMIKGAECLVFPFASPQVCGNRKDIWGRYLLARAYDNMSYVLAVNCWQHNDKLNYAGGAIAIDPMANVIKSKFNNYTNLLIDVKKEVVTERRKNKKLNYLSRRRKELYL